MLIRQARPSEQRALEDLQRRASLNNPGDRDALLGPRSYTSSAIRMRRASTRLVAFSRMERWRHDSGMGCR
jgi:hypothetical protein